MYIYILKAASRHLDACSTPLEGRRHQSGPSPLKVHPQPEKASLRAVHLSRHKWPGELSQLGFPETRSPQHINSEPACLESSSASSPKPLNCHIFTPLNHQPPNLSSSLQGHLDYKNPPPVGPYISPMPRDLWWS